MFITSIKKWKLYKENYIQSDAIGYNGKPFKNRHDGPPQKPQHGNGDDECAH